MEILKQLIFPIDLWGGTVYTWLFLCLMYFVRVSFNRTSLSPSWSWLLNIKHIVSVNKEKQYNLSLTAELTLTKFHKIVESVKVLFFLKITANKRLSLKSNKKESLWNAQADHKIIQFLIEHSDHSSKRFSTTHKYLEPSLKLFFVQKT